MKITFVGTGSAFCMENFQTNTMISRNDRNLLIDAGGDIRWSLRALKDSGLSYKDINSIYISHCHADHVGGMEWFGFCTYFDPTITEKIEVIGNNELIRDLWENSLKGGLKSIQGKRPKLNDYFDLVQVRKNRKFDWEGIIFEIVQSVHIMDGYSIVPTFGLMVKDPDTHKKIYYTGDTQFNPNQIMDFYEEADLIIQDCETTPFKSGVHANYSDLSELPEHIKSKMLLQHYQDLILDIPEDRFALGKEKLRLVTILLAKLAEESDTGDVDYILQECKDIIEDVRANGFVEEELQVSDDWNSKAYNAGFMKVPGAVRRTLHKDGPTDAYGFVPRGTVIDTVEQWGLNI